MQLWHIPANRFTSKLLFPQMQFFSAVSLSVSGFGWGSFLPGSPATGIADGMLIDVEGVDCCGAGTCGAWAGGGCCTGGGCCGRGCWGGGATTRGGMDIGGIEGRRGAGMVTCGTGGSDGAGTVRKTVDVGCTKTGTINGCVTFGGGGGGAGAGGGIIGGGGGGGGGAAGVEEDVDEACGGSEDGVGVTCGVTSTDGVVCAASGGGLGVESCGSGAGAAKGSVAINTGDASCAGGWASCAGCCTPCASPTDGTASCGCVGVATATSASFCAGGLLRWWCRRATPPFACGGILCASGPSTFRRFSRRSSSKELSTSHLKVSSTMGPHIVAHSTGTSSIWSSFAPARAARPVRTSTDASVPLILSALPKDTSSNRSEGGISEITR